MRFNVEGADSATGADRVVQIDARDEREAEAKARAQGLLVSSVYRTVTKTHQEALDELAEAAAKADPLPQIDYLTSPAAKPHWRRPAVPSYNGLRAGARILVAFGIISVAAGGVFMVVAIALMFLGTDAPRGVRALAGFVGVLYALYAVLVGGLFWAAGEACLALRDIAQNTSRLAAK